LPHGPVRDLLPFRRAPRGANTRVVIPDITIDSYVQSFSASPDWAAAAAWPPDAYALASLVLDHAEAYRFAVAPPAPWRWPPAPEWNESVVAAGRAWRASASCDGSSTPPAVREQVDVISRRRDTPLAAMRGGADAELSAALLTLHAMADEAAAEILARSPREFEQRALALLGSHQSLSRFPASRIRVLPKTRVPTRGLTIRSFSRYLALSYEAVAVEWQRTTVGGGSALAPSRDFNAVLLPWPFDIRSDDFRPVAGPIDNLDRGAFGFFEFAPRRSLPLELVAAVLDDARRWVRRIDVVVLPEESIETSELAGLESMLADRGVRSLIAGVRASGSGGAAPSFGANRVHVGVRDGDRWRRIEQAKHHRWCLDGSQIRQYHLSRALDPRRQWWEAVDLPERCIEVLDTGGGVTVAPLICEDLARIDEVADVLRRIGPTLVVALLLDGPQLRTRWPSRYASVLSDDPGSAVLTITSLGMALRSRPAGARASRVVASWSDPSHGARELELHRGASALLVTASVGTSTGWTADGRRHADGTADLAVSGVHQLRVRSRGDLRPFPARSHRGDSGGAE
jgi:hypothetical protein